MTPYEWAEKIAADLTAADVRATVDVKSVNPPCVLVEPPTRVLFDLPCGGTADMTLTLFAFGPGQSEAWKTLDGLMGRVLDVVDGVTEAVTTTYQLSENRPPLPVYQLTIQTPVEWR